MHWIFAILGAFLGAAFGGTDDVLLGLVLGAFVGWQAGRMAELGARVRALEAVQGQRAATGAVMRDAPAPVQRRDAGTANAAAAPPQPPTPQPATSQPFPQAPMPARGPVAAAPAHAAAVPSRATGPETGAAPATATPRWQPPPRTPDLGDRIGGFLRRLFFEGNVPVKIGSLVLFVGIGGALKLAVDQGYIALPIELRLAAIALAAIGVLVWGWRNREQRPAFGLSLQGLAIGVLLLTVFAAFRLYALLPATLAFALVVVLVAAAALLAVLQHAVWLALLGLIGGYLAPVLVSTGSGNHIALFTYYALLNAAVFGIAWVRPWRALNLVGFGFTFVVGTLWGARYYRPEHFASVEPFLLLFVLFYVGLPVLYALRQPEARRGLVDGTLLFGTPLLAFPLQAAMLRGEPMLLAYSALGLAALYAALTTWLLRRPGTLLLGQSFAALAIGFATLAIPLALSAHWTAAAWAVEGAALVWLGLRQQRRLPQIAGWILQGLAMLAYLAALLPYGRGMDALAGEWPIVNGHAFGVLLMSLSAFFIAWCHEHTRPHRLLVWPPFLLGLAWWCVAGLREVNVHLEYLHERNGVLAFLALTAVLAATLRGALGWARLGWIVLPVAAGSLLMAVAVEAWGESPLRWPAAGFWLLLLAALAFALSRLRAPLQRGVSFAHVASLWTLAVALGLALRLEAAGLQGLGDGWQLAVLVLPLALLVLAGWRWPAMAGWPLADRFAEYRWRWLAPAMAVLAVWWTLALAARGAASPLPFVPVLNPLELLQLAMLLVALRWMLRARPDDATHGPLRVLVPLAAFAFVTTAALRAVHHTSGVAWSPSMLDSATAQTTLTVVWSVTGVLAWVLGSRRRAFPVWLAGAVLMGVVLVKLVLVDRQYMGDFAGIVSFLAVGALLVLVGRLAPTPPRSLAAGATS